MEKMTEAELKKLRELQAKAKRIERAEKWFLEEADRRKAELLKRWGMKGVEGEHPHEGRVDEPSGSANRTELSLDESQPLTPSDNELEQGKEELNEQSEESSEAEEGGLSYGNESHSTQWSNW